MVHRPRSVGRGFALCGRAITLDRTRSVFGHVMELVALRSDTRRSYSRGRGEGGLPFSGTSRAMLVARWRDFLADPQKHDFEPVGIMHCDAADFRVATPLLRHLLPGQELLGAVQFGGVPRTPEDARYPGFAHIVPGGPADLPDHQRQAAGLPEPRRDQRWGAVTAGTARRLCASLRPRASWPWARCEVRLRKCTSSRVKYPATGGGSRVILS